MYHEAADENYYEFEFARKSLLPTPLYNRDCGRLISRLIIPVRSCSKSGCASSAIRCRIPLGHVSNFFALIYGSCFVVLCLIAKVLVPHTVQNMLWKFCEALKLVM